VTRLDDRELATVLAVLEERSDRAE